MLQRIAMLAIAAPRRIVVIAALVMAACGIFGIPVAQHLSAGGFQDPTSESAQATQLLVDKFGQGDMELVISVTDDGGAQGPAASTVGTDIAAQLAASPNVAQVTSAWTSPASASPALISKDGKTGLIVAGITGGESDAQKHAKELTDRLVHDRDGVIVKAGGVAMTYVQINGQSEKDLLMMEAIAIPLVFVVLVWVFGGLMAAALPLAVGVFAILGSMAVLRTITLFTDVSIFALNLSIAMGLALAIDYTLLIISRFRDELADGADRDRALVRTMATAGRTVLFSALTVALSMVAMVLFPMYFLKSFAYAGIAVVAFAAVAAIVVAPAAIVLLGDHLDSLDTRRLFRWLLRRPEAERKPVEQMFWYRSTKFVMRRSIPVGVAIVGLLLLLGAPFLGIKWGFPDDRVLPQSLSARQVGDELRSNFAVDSSTNVTVVIPDAAGVPPAELDRYAAALSRVADVSSVSAPGGTFVDGRLAGPPSAATGMEDGSAFLTIGSTAPLFTDASEAQLDAVQAVPTPAGEPVQVTGLAQINRDSSQAITSRLPLVLGVIAAITFVLLFLLTGSVVLPLKALVLNVLSLTAAFGALVWIFQDGHLGALGTTPTGTLVANMPVLLFCIAFGLSMDYEVFLVSRIREFWLASGKTRADNDESVALGLARTGRVVTAAALVMSISFAALIAAEVSFMRMMGVGMTLAVLADATLVRMALVPAFMHVLGRWNWWAPKPLARLHERIGISESADEPVPDAPKLVDRARQFPMKRRRAPRGSGEQLRDEILDATTDLLLETGHAKEVSIRSVAQRVGVTSPSIYLHFADKDALLDAVCAGYFEKLDEEMQAAAADQPSSIEVLRAQGLAYARFALKTPELYRIAMMGEGRPGSDVDNALNTSAFVHMRTAIETLMDEDVYPRGDATEKALELWTVAHGVVAMLISRPYLPWGDNEEFADRVLSAVCFGHLALGRVNPDASPQEKVAQLRGWHDEQHGR